MSQDICLLFFKLTLYSLLPSLVEASHKVPFKANPQLLRDKQYISTVDRSVR